MPQHSIAAGAHSGYLYYANEAPVDWEALVDQTVCSDLAWADPVIRVYSIHTNVPDIDIYRGTLRFDTSVLARQPRVATLKMYPQAKGSGTNVVRFMVLGADFGTPSTDDWDDWKVGATTLVDADLSAHSLNTVYDVDVPPALISVSGHTCFMLREHTYDVGATPPAQNTVHGMAFHSENATGANEGYRPVLELIEPRRTMLGFDRFGTTGRGLVGFSRAN